MLLVYLGVWVCLVIICSSSSSTTTLWKADDTEEAFQFGEKMTKYVIYRLIGNDMPPLQMTGQLRWNTEYALKNEPQLPGVQKKWILNRIWNETELHLLYSTLLRYGVNRRDIIVRCFDLDAFAGFPTKDDQLFYLTAQNEGRNVGILDGRENGFEWSIILDGNTFISLDSWNAMKKALEKATKEQKLYYKIPYHRVHSEQSEDWLNRRTDMNTILQFAPTKGESQIAFHKNAKTLFTLGDTNSNAKDPHKKKGYGQRNKSYLFKEGQICGEGSRVCACADVFEGNEEDLKGMKLTTSYAKECGLVLRLWSYPTENVIFTGLTSEEEEGFFYFYHVKHDSIEHVYTECTRFGAAVELWKGMTSKEKQKYRSNTALVKQYHDEYHNIFLTESCFRSRDREIAQNMTYDGINALIKKYGIKSSGGGLRGKKITPTDDDEAILKQMQNSNNGYVGFCRAAYKHGQGNNKHYLTIFDEKTMKQEKSDYQTEGSTLHNQLVPYVSELMRYADKALTYPQLSVMTKERTPAGETNKRYYFSNRPFHWHVDDLTSVQRNKLSKKQVEVDEDSRTVHVSDQVNPAYFIGSVTGDINYDKASLFYTITNTTTLALAWYYNRNNKYAAYAAKLVDTYFLSDSVGMLPSLTYAEEGGVEGVLDAKDMYYFMDALTLLEQSGMLTQSQVKKMQRWCGKLVSWMMQSNAGHVIGHGKAHTEDLGGRTGSGVATSGVNNNRAVSFDLMTLALANYAQDLANVDYARNRLIFRLSEPAPFGVFALDGSCPHEVVHSSPLHYIVVNLVTWMHAAAVNENIRKNSLRLSDFDEDASNLLEDGIISLWDVVHTTESSDPDATPVLLKATQWMMQYMPVDAEAYTAEWTSEGNNPLPRMSKPFPFHQKKSFHFARMLECVNYAVQAYGVDRVFGEDYVSSKKLYTDAVAGLPLYTLKTDVHMFKNTPNPYNKDSTKRSTMTSSHVDRSDNFYSAHSMYESGARLWSALGLPQSRLGANQSVANLPFVSSESNNKKIRPKKDSDS